MMLDVNHPPPRGIDAPLGVKGPYKVHEEVSIHIIPEPAM
jgi:hypothetical protein